MIDILQQVNVLYENDQTINSMLTLGIQGTHVTATASTGMTGGSQDYQKGRLPQFDGSVCNLQYARGLLARIASLAATSTKMA